MKNKILSLLALLMTATTGAWAQEPEYIDLTTVNYKTWTLDAMPAYGLDLIVEYETELALANAGDNTQKLFEWDECEANVTLTNRTLTKSGEWNTLCLPFGVTAAQIAETTHPLYGATIKELDTATSNLAIDGTLTLNFTTASSITAGIPYIVRWEETSGSVIEPVFNDVTVSSTTPTPITSTDGKVTFVGQYSPFKIGDVTNGDDGNLNEIIMMGSGSTLGYSKNTRTLNCFRAHFYVKSDGGTAGARCFVMNFEEGTQTGICHTDFTDLTDHADAWYSLDGRKLDSQPTKKGVYIQNGKKVVIR